MKTKYSSKDPQLPPFPTGWYALATSAELKKEGILTKKLAADEVVIYRTRKGIAKAIEPFCPHLGAHFGHGGSVKGESLRCPFHGFCFNTEGSCVKTAYGTRPPRRAKLRKYPIHEVNGFILVYYDENGESPAWYVPEVEMEGWTKWQSLEWKVKSHPQETTENSVDVGHFNITHGFENVDTLQPATMQGPYLTALYAMNRPSFLPKIIPAVRSEFRVHVHGLGYSFVEVKLPKLGLELRTIVQPVPIEEGKIILRLGISMKKCEPLNWLNGLFLKILLKSFAADVAHDLEIWENKKYIARPLLALGDGPIAEYRRWAKQFYPNLSKIQTPCISLSSSSVSAVSA